ncbi:MAG: sigma-70 family RNA polymerase sigma factor [Candidatus Acidiferrales bacterium]
MSELQQGIEAFQPAFETWTGVRTAEEARPVLPSEDWRIVQRALRGDSDALSSLFGRDAGRLYRSAHSLLRNTEDAEDALQDGLLNAYINLGSFEGRSKFTTWLTRIVMNAALMNRRRLRARPSVPLDELPAEVIPLASPVTGPSPNPVELFARSETRNTVLDAINQLSPPLRSAFRLRHIQGLSTREAAKAEGIKINVLKSRLWRARKQLASLLNERGMTLANCSFP